MEKMKIDLKIDWSLAIGKWDSILSYAGIPAGFLQKGKAQACPICGTGHDRYTYSDYQGSGSYFCRKCPDGGPMNGLRLYADYKNISLKDATIEIMEFLQGSGNATPSKPKIVEQVGDSIEEKQSIEVTYPAPLANFSPDTSIEFINDKKFTKKSYRFQTIYEWRDVDDNLVGYIGRTSAKVCMQLYHGKANHDGVIYPGNWFQGSLGKNRPPFCGNPVREFSKGLIVEGEKNADFAGKHLKNYAVVSWTGGANAYKLTRWKDLPNIPWYILPDNDEPGRKAANGIKVILGKLGYNATILDPNPRKVGADIMDYVCVEDWDMHIDSLAESKLSQQEDLALSAETFFSDKLVPLGHKDGILYFSCKRKDRHGRVTKSIEEITPATISSNSLLFLATKDEWFNLAPGEKGVDWEVVKDTLVRACEKEGEVDIHQIKKQGFWWSENGITFNDGGAVHVDTKQVIESVVDGSAYELTNTMLSREFSWDDKFTKSDYILIKEAFDLISFETEDQRTAARGWALAALGCGMYQYRPHLNMNGRTATGKSTFLKILKAMFGKFHESFNGNETGAGFRIKTNNKAVPVLFDEAEVETFNHHSLIEIESCKRLAYERGAEQVRGTATQELRRYYMNFMMAQVAVNAQYKEATNINREIPCKLVPKERNFIKRHEHKIKEVVHNIKERRIPEKLIATLYRKREEIEEALIQLNDDAPPEVQGRITKTMGIPLVVDKILSGEPMQTQELLNNTLWGQIHRRSSKLDIALQILDAISKYEVTVKDKESRVSKCSVADLFVYFLKHKNLCPPYSVLAPMDLMSVQSELKRLGIFPRLFKEPLLHSTAKELEQYGAKGYEDELSKVGIYFEDSVHIRKHIEKTLGRKIDYVETIITSSHAEKTPSPMYIGKTRYGVGKLTVFAMFPFGGVDVEDLGFTLKEEI